MLSRFLVFFGLFISSILSGHAEVTDSVITDTTLNPTPEVSTIPEEPGHINVDAFDFSVFKNHADPDDAEKTLQVGKITISWDNIFGDDYSLGLKRDGKWQFFPLEKEANKITLDSIEENHFYQTVFIKRGSESPEEVSDTLHIHTISPSAFKFLSSKKGEGEAELYWGINSEELIRHGYDKAIIKYNTKVGKKHGTHDWAYEIVELSALKFKLEDLDGNTDYVYQIGIPKDGNIEAALSALENGKDPDIIWSKEGKFKSERTWGILKVLMLLGALGFFIYGMKMMSDGLQRASGSRLRQILSSMTSNRVKGIFSGFFITGIVQSSSATTVMTVSLVNAGLLTLVQSAGIMMGANIGTTITGWLISTFGFKVSLSDYSLVMIALAIPLLFNKSSKLKAWGQTILGFAILFWGLSILKDMTPKLDASSPIVQFFADYKDTTFLGPIMFVLLGTLVTIIIQSSSASMALTLAMVLGGIIPVQVAAAMILGENIGTTITAQLASLVGNVHAKRAARFHAIFNLIGVAWMIFLIGPFMKLVAGAMTSMDMIDADPFSTTEEGLQAATLVLAGFHTAFNLVNVFLLVWFVPQLVNFAIKSVKSKGDSDEEFHLDYITGGTLATAELSLLEAKKEVAKFGTITARMNQFVHKLLTEKDKKKKTKLYSKIEKYEDITDRVEIEVASYLSQVSKSEMTQSESVRVRSMLSITNDLERVGDIFYQMSKTIERKEEAKLWFLPEQRERLKEMFDLIDQAFVIMNENLNSEFGQINIEKAKDIEFMINAKRDELRTEHLKNLEKGEIQYNMQSGLVYSDLFASLEKIGDHIINVSEAVDGQI